jgi:hypothetical protein
MHMSGRKPLGLTLAEILLAIGVASISIIGVALVLATIWRAASEGKYQAAASNLARSRIEKMRGDQQYLTGVLQAAGPTVVKDIVKVDDKIDTEFETKITPTPLTGSTAYFDVVVQVSWDQEHRKREVKLETVLPDPR